MTTEKPAWHWKDLVYLLFLVLVMVPIFIEYGLFHWLFSLFENELYAGTLTGMAMAIVFTTGLYLIVLKPRKQSWKEVGCRPFAVRHWLDIAVWMFILIAASVLLVIVMDLFGVSTANSKTESLQSQLTVAHFLIAFASASIVSPIYEEIFYRGFLYRFFSSRYGVWPGMLISSAIFTFVHIPTFNTLPVNFVSGMVFAWIYQKTGSVIPAIVMHGLFNGIAITLTALG